MLPLVLVGMVTLFTLAQIQLRNNIVTIPYGKEKAAKKNQELLG